MSYYFPSHLEASADVGFLVVGRDGPFLIGQKGVEKKDAGGTGDAVEQALDRRVPVELRAERHGRDRLDPLEGRPVGQKVKGVTCVERTEHFRF